MPPASTRGRACHGFAAERTNVSSLGSPARAINPPPGSTTATAPRCHDSSRPPRVIAARGAKAFGAAATRNLAFLFEGSFDRLVAREELVQAGGLEQPADAIGGVDQDELAIGVAKLGEIADQLADPCRVDVVDAGEIHQDVALVLRQRALEGLGQELGALPELDHALEPQQHVLPDPPLLDDHAGPSRGRGDSSRRTARCGNGISIPARSSASFTSSNSSKRGVRSLWGSRSHVLSSTCTAESASAATTTCGGGSAATAGCAAATARSASRTRRRSLP